MHLLSRHNCVYTHGINDNQCVNNIPALLCIAAACIHRHTDAWWTGIHTVNGKCGWFQVNNTRSDINPLDTLKDDIKQKYGHFIL